MMCYKDMVFPTCVGMNRLLLFRYPGGRRVPHMRGDEPKEGKLLPAWEKCSPHAWG